MPDFKGEKLEKKLQTREVYYYHDEALKIKQVSREVYQNKDEVIHYPRGFEGGPKYTSIRRFIFKGFKGKLPVGVYKSSNFGWGFTRPLKPFASFLNENYTFQDVIIEKNGKDQWDIPNKILYLTEKGLSLLNSSFGIIFKKNNDEVNHVLLITLHELFPKDFHKPKKTYVANALASSLATWGNSIDEFSEDDKTAIKDLFDKLSLRTDFISSDALAKTKEIVDNKYIQATLKEFSKLMKFNSNTEGLEKKWQLFLKTNSWIFSSIFAQPVILYKDEAYVGGKTIDNTNGKFNDFLIKNSLSDNVSFLEIKTHKTKLLENAPYRGVDVYSATKDLTGCIVQVLNQRDNFQKEFYHTKGKLKGKQQFETFNSKCVVLIGSTKDLNDGQNFSFELFRSNSRDVEILTFDELENKIKSLQKILETKPAKPRRRKKLV
jgi:hypothetical protein